MTGDRRCRLHRLVDAIRQASDGGREVTIE
jgi:hypothetical protein